MMENNESVNTLTRHPNVGDTVLRKLNFEFYWIYEIYKNDSRSIDMNNLDLVSALLILYLEQVYRFFDFECVTIGGLLRLRWFRIKTIRTTLRDFSTF